MKTNQNPYYNILGWIDTIYPESSYYVLDKEFNYVFFNAGHAEIMKKVWNKDIEIGHSIFEYPDEQKVHDRIEGVYARVMKGETVSEIHEYVIDEQEGELERHKYYHPYYEMVDGELKLAGILMIGTDRPHSERIRLEQELLRNEKLMRETNDLAKIGGWELDLRTNEPYFTSGTFDIYDIENQEVPMMEDGLSYYSPAAQKVLVKAIEEVIANHSSYDLEVDFISQKGVKKVVRTLGKVDVENGEPVRLYGAIQDITARKLEEQNIADNRARFEAIFTGAPLPISMIKLNGDLIGVNPAFERIIGYTAEEIPNIETWYTTCYKEEVHELARQNWLDIQNKTKAGVTQFEPLTRDVLCKAGRLHKMELHFARAQDFLIIIFIDFTERDAAKAALTISEEMYRNLYNLAPVMIDSLNKVGEIIHVNDFWLSKLGYEREEVLGRKIFDFIHKEDRESSELAFQRFVITHEIDNFRFRFIKKDGEPMNTVVNAYAEFDNNDQFSNTISVYQDITQRIKAEKELINANTRITNLINNIPGMVFQASGKDKRRLTFVSSNGVEMFGIAMEDLEEKEVCLGDLIQADDREEIEEQILNQLERFNNYSVIYYANSELAGAKWLQESGTLSSNEGEWNIEGSIFDITDRVLTQERLAATTMETEDRERTRISKEIHDGLQQTLGLSSLIFDNLLASDSLSDEHRQVVNEGLRHLNSAMSECRDIAHRLMPVSITDFGLIHAIENLVSDLNGSGTLTAEFICNIDDDLQLKKTSETSIFRIIQEAFNNIQKHSKAKHCSIQLLKIGEYIQVSIEDDGIGFEHPLDKDQDNAAKLGLQNMLNRATSMGGQLLVESQKEGGTLIIGRIPLNQNRKE